MVSVLMLWRCSDCHETANLQDGFKKVFDKINIIVGRVRPDGGRRTVFGNCFVVFSACEQLQQDPVRANKLHEISQ